MVEAVIVVPVLGILWVGTSFAREQCLARQHALIMARRCAWEHSMSGCEDRKLTTDCKMKPEQSAEAERESSGIIDRTQNEVAKTRGQVGGDDFDVFGDVPLIGKAIKALIGTTTGATVSIDVPVPWKKGASVPSKGTFGLACNERPQDVGQAIRSVFCKALGSWACGP